MPEENANTADQTFATHDHPPSPTPPAPDTLTKAQADALTAQARKDAAKEAEQALLKQFGEGMTATKVKEILEAQKAADDAKKDEATRAREAAEAEKRTAEQERGQAAAERLRTRVERALLRAGVARGEEDEAKAERLLERAYGALGSLSADLDDDAIRARVAELKEDMPALFAAPTPEWQPAPGGLPGNGKPPAKTPPDDLAQARERGKKWREQRTGTQTDPFAGFRRIG